MVWDEWPKELAPVFECQHEWGDELKRRNRGSVGEKSTLNGGDMVSNIENTQGQFCQLCNAWRGSLGLEPTPGLFIDHIVQIFREVKRVLRKDGTVWLNLGDSYASGKGSCFNPGGGENSLEGHAKLKEHNAYKLNRPNVSDLKDWGLKPKDLIGIPWRVALALQADGWYLRSDIIWAKSNPMPESVTDRPTKSHEYLFLLSKSPKYFYDADAIREPHQDINRPNGFTGKDGIGDRSTNQGWSGGEVSLDKHRNYNPSGRNKRTVWTIATQPMPEAHFATFPEKLIEPCILAGTSEKGCCVECGAPWERVVEKRVPELRDVESEYPGEHTIATRKYKHNESGTESKTIGWIPTCNCKYDHVRDFKPVPCTVLDPFFGSGTTGIVAHKHGRNFIGIELSESYLKDIAIPRIEKATGQRKLF